MRRAASLGYAIIARMPLHFGLLAGRFDTSSRFAANDHRSFRLTPAVLERASSDLMPFFDMSSRLGIAPAALALAFVLSHPEVSTVIPGIRTPKQAALNTEGPFSLSQNDLAILRKLYDDRLADLLALMHREESR
jgi:aryl-alcohol dehydrogenase-like predicted oxidoreductase